MEPTISTSEHTNVASPSIKIWIRRIRTSGNVLSKRQRSIFHACRSPAYQSLHHFDPVLVMQLKMQAKSCHGCFRLRQLVPNNPNMPTLWLKQSMTVISTASYFSNPNKDPKDLPSCEAESFWTREAARATEKSMYRWNRKR